LSIKEALAAGDTPSVDVHGYLFGFGASGGPVVVTLCSEPGDPCVLPKLKLAGLDFEAAKNLMTQADALDGLLVNGDGFRETEQVTLTGRLRGDTLVVG
jgi:hypothetical protein